jgi:hypothetical protein
MRRGRVRSLIVLALIGGASLALSACGRGDDSAGPGDVTVSEAKALDEAAEMIEARKPPPPVANPSAPLPPDSPQPAQSAGPR